MAPLSGRNGSFTGSVSKLLFIEQSWPWPPAGIFQFNYTLTIMVTNTKRACWKVEVLMVKAGHRQVAGLCSLEPDASVQKESAHAPRQTSLMVNHQEIPIFGSNFSRSSRKADIRTPQTHVYFDPLF